MYETIRSYLRWPQLISAGIGMVTAFAIYGIINATTVQHQPIALPPGVHVHADFAVYLDHQQMDFTDSRFQSPAGDYKHPSLHLHNGNGHVIHRHAEGVTMGEFFTSLGYTITSSSITTDTGLQFTNTDTEQLLFFVNGELHDNLLDYVFADEDRMLIYFGDPTDPRLEEYLEAVTDEACIYSHTCPERGTAPPSDCAGITCEA